MHNDCSKTIKIIDWWINQKKCGMEKLQKDWNYLEEDHHEIAQTLLNADKTIISNLVANQK
jgi:hypothetical protein